ncbi:MAG TPA: lysine--tRNA ligase [Candidatus Paceibacterota bacterium]
MASLKELREERLAKVAELRELGIDPYPARTKRTNPISDIVDNFDQHDGKEVVLAGRLFSWRAHGPLIFGDVQDEQGKIQLYIKEEVIAHTSKENQNIGFADLNLIDIGDILEVEGVVTKTKRGEISIEPKYLRVLTKSLRPLPEKWEGLVDQEQIFRRRYLDLAINPAQRDLFRRKTKFWEANREFMNNNGFQEMQTPVMELVPGGADARPFVTHHNALDQDFYLRISPELYLKRLLGGGFEKVYTIGPNFRNEGIDDEHLQEFSAIEWYWAYASYHENMELVRDCIRHVAQAVYGKTEFTRGDHTFDLANEWQEVDYVEIIKQKFRVDIFTTSDDEILKILKENGVNLDEGEISRNRLVDNLWKVIRKTISGPAFLVNEPKFMSPLAKSKADNPELTERFHVLLAGSELGNGYSELNDPVDQFERFKEQQNARDAGDEESQMLDIDFVEMLEYGMPPASGYAHSERLFDFFENITAREGTLFPQMRNKLDDTTREIYGL